MPKRILAILITLLVIAIAAWAVTPQFWEDFTQEDLLKGDFNHVSLTPEGKLLLAPAFDSVYDTGQSYIFSMVRDKAGNLYVGTGDEGKVFKIDPQGKGSLYFQSKELDIFALALDTSGALYVGTSPDGKVYKVNGPDRSTEFCDPENKYIWSMVFDDAGNLYVGTGPNGAIYKVDKNGKKTAFYTCSDNHVTCLTRGMDNKILAGTSPHGLIVEINPEGKGFALMDTLLEEVHSIVFDRFGTLYAIASSMKGLSSAPSSKPAESSSAKSVIGTSTTITVVAVAGIPEKSKEAKTVSAPGGGRESSGAKSAIYAITKDGSVETVYSSDKQMVFDAVVRDDGSLLVATGPKGRLLSIDTAKQVTVLTDSAEEDSTRLLMDGESIYVGSSNQGKVYRLRTQKAQTGTFESKTLDARIMSSWGKIFWHTNNSANSNIEISTRSGNTEKADNSWSDWSAPYAPGAQMTNPRARYLQWRAAFKGASGAAAEMLDRVQIAYLQQNIRPQVTDIEALPYGVELQKQSSLAMGISPVIPSSTPDGRSLNAPRERFKERQPLPPRQALQPGAQSFTWKAIDDNEDSLEFSLYFKGEGESDWKLLEKKLTDTFYTLNAASLPDGTYRLKVLASDAPCNPYDKYLIGELISNPFVIANASPQVEITGSKVNGKKVEAQFRARVAIGHIATAEFSIDGGEWRLIFPTDGIADSPQEEYRIGTPDLSPGEHLIGIRSSDGNGNTGTAKLVVKIP
jgi:hypothetical protein